MTPNRARPYESVVVSVVVPVKDNATSLEELVERIERALALESFEIVLIDDGSEDSSWKVMEELAARRESLRVFRLARNYGQQAALCAGFEKARGQVVATLDADLQYPPEAIPAFLESWRSGHDLVCGHRVVRQDPYFRRVLPSRLFNVAVRWISGSRVIDVGCALNAIDRRILEELPRCGERRRFLKPLLADRSRSLAQLPVEATRREGPSSYSFVSLASLAIDFFVVYSARPFRWMLVTGAALVVLGGAGTVVGCAAWSLAAHSQGTTVLIALAVLFLGFHLVSIGLLGETLQRQAREREGRAFYRFRDGDEETER